jgi:peptide/nickel transport system ATP-binding protein
MEYQLKSNDVFSANESEYLIEFKNITKIFKSGHIQNYALDGINLKIKAGESVSVVGESGSGKTTLGLLAVKLLNPNKGEINFEGRNIAKIRGSKLREFRLITQMVFQDPYSSLNPYNTILESVALPLISNKSAIEKRDGVKLTRDVIRKRVAVTLDRVGLSPGESFLDLYPKKLSGGQRQRVAIARALVLNPRFIVADEPTSMLDVSISAQVLNLLSQLKKEFNFSMIYISHELATSRFISEKMAVMNLGRIVEYGRSEDITDHPMHPYSDILIKSVPEIGGFIDTDNISKIDYNVLNGGMKGCTFAHSCPKVTDKCIQERPELQDMGNEHYVACFHPL